jgi:5-methylcytosine-specific restriction enzyme A
LCGRLVASGYCDVCQAKGRGKDLRPSASKRLYDGRWRKASKAYLLEHPLCVDPYGVHGEVLVAATDVDHIEPHRGDPVKFGDRNNWQGLCHSCHSRKTATEDGGFGR